MWIKQSNKLGNCPGLKKWMKLSQGKISHWTVSGSWYHGAWWYCVYARFDCLSHSLIGIIWAWKAMLTVHLHFDHSNVTKQALKLFDPILWIYSFRMSLSPCLKKWGIRKPHTCSGGTRIFCGGGGGHRGGKMRFWGSKNQKICQKWLILAIFPFWLGGGMWGAEPPVGGQMPPMVPLDATTAYLGNFALQNKEVHKKLWKLSNSC